MRLHRFFVVSPIDAKKGITLSTDAAEQIRRVFRLKTGDSVVAFDASGFDYTCRIENFDKGGTVLSVLESAKSRFVPERDIYLCAAIVKKDTFEWIVEKATELGVTHIIPVMAERTEKKSLNEERLKKIAVEASEQSGRGTVPEIQAPVSLEECIAKIKSGAEKSVSISALALHTEGELLKHSELDKYVQNNAPIALFIGPEGGWSAKEIELFHKNDVVVGSLGSQVLRSETAVISALSLVVFNK